MDLQILASVLTVVSVLVTGMGVAIALASFNRTARRDRAEDSARLEGRLGARIDKLDAKVDTVNTNLGDRINSVETNLGARIDQLDAKIDTVNTNLGDRINSVETNLGARIDTFRTDLEARIDAQGATFRSDLAEFRAENRADMAEVRSSLRSLEQRFYDFLVPRPAPTGTEDA